MSTPTLIMALRRFLIRKGYPEKFISDNFKSFKSSILKKFIRDKRIKWDFIEELSPWWGGFYERLVKVVKNALRKNLRNAKVNYVELETLLIEIEGMINARPLTYISDDPNNTEPITPYHLLHGRNILISKGNLCNETSERNLTNRATYLQTLIEKIWKRFYHEYTTALRERMLYDKTKRSESKLKINDVVIIKDDKLLSRSKWKRGRVDELIIGRDGVVRGAMLETVTNGKNTKIRRSLQRSVPLEVTENSLSFWTPDD